jgi:hypothetical protein
MAMSQQHKDALAKGRVEARAIAAYLDSLGSRKRGRPVTEAGVRKQLEAVRAKIKKEPNALRKVELVQKRLDLEKKLAALQPSGDRSDLEAAFVRHAGAYSGRKGISYTAWREAGVSPAVLTKAGIRRR